MKHNGEGPDVSIADWRFCWTAAKWGFSVEEIKEKLQKVSTKAQTDGESHENMILTRSFVQPRHRSDRHVAYTMPVSARVPGTHFLASELLESSLVHTIEREQTRKSCKIILILRC